jgi:purine-binding chemotaxis protein CheW
MEYQLVIFTIGNENYGVDIASVEGIVKMQAITNLPHKLGFVEGITNLRGEIIPVINLRKRFGMASNIDDKNTRIVIAKNNAKKIGMIVDSVSEVLRIQDSCIEPPPAMVSTADAAYVTGIAKIEGRLIILLNLSKILSMEEQVQVQAMVN